MMYTIPPAFERHRTLLERARELHSSSPETAWCLRLFAAQTAMQMRPALPAQFVHNIMNEAESGSQGMPSTTEEIRLARAKAFAIDLWSRAAAADEPSASQGVLSKVAGAYHAAAVIIESLTQSEMYTPLPPELQSRQQQAHARSQALARQIGSVQVALDWQPATLPAVLPGPSPSPSSLAAAPPSSQHQVSSLPPQVSSPPTQAPSAAQAMAGAAAVGGVLGALASGPLLAVAGAGSAAVAASRSDKVGEASRSVGQAVSSGWA
eukprot:CAMPEP_0119334668 /NCGR_PEP_ID=MMETSP1333-20130426/87790_1 /TAXON_ID=418940 /ORGANISM="Scyphosphaera apsteinii, Strain RCC1455" /LENGTH=264 /DNA_ID=CAMNT_0007345017 /DNA_START=16 /DNA_END=806 /DNA_ORIENTATION=+